MPDTSSDISCFDVFDTLLTRKVSDPTSVFFLTAQQAIKASIINCPPEVYVSIRRQAEQLSRKEADDGQIHYLRIFDYLSEILSISQSQSRQLMALELEWEKNVLCALPGALQLVNQERDKGKQIVYVSDMYWSADILKDFLMNAGIYQDKDEIWVSSEHGASKDTGRLFNKVFETRPHAKRSTTNHFGNDFYIDYKGALKAGLLPVLIEKGNANRYEILLDSFRQHTNGFSAILSGAGRLFRLKHAIKSDRNSEIARVIANVAGPSLLMYVIWIFNEAKRHQLQRLCFISRDGYIPYLIAKKIAPEYGINLDIQYIYGSRQAWHLPGITEINTHTFSWLFDQHASSSCRNIFNRIELEWETVIQAAPELSQIITQANDILTSHQIEAIKTALINNEQLNQLILDLAKKKREIVLQYLNENNLFPDRKTGMIEIGWKGKTRVSFEHILGNNASQNLHWLYLGLAHNLPLNTLNNCSTFLYGPMLNYTEVISLPQIVESFCFARHGSVTGFEYTDGKVAPRFNTAGEEAYDAWGRQIYLKLFEEYIDDLPINLFAHLECGNLRFPAHELLKMFCENPDRKDAEIWGDMPFVHQQEGKKISILAPPLKTNWLSIKQALQFGKLRLTANGGYSTVWGAGTWARKTSTPWMLCFFTFLGYLRVNKSKELRRILSETKQFLKRIVNPS